MKQLLTILFSVNVLLANSPLVEPKLPQPINPFKLSYSDLHSEIENDTDLVGKIIVQFIIDKEGQVIEPEIVDSFNIVFNDVILDKVRQMKFTPPLQNGEPVEVRYKLPIAFK